MRRKHDPDKFLGNRGSEDTKEPPVVEVCLIHAQPEPVMSRRVSKWTIQRSTDRPLGGPASIGRVPKIGLAHTDPRGRLRDQQEPAMPDGMQNKRVILAWSLGLIMVTVITLGAIFAYWISQRAATHTPAVAQAEATQPATAPQTAKLPHKPPSEQEALDMVKKALEISSPDDVTNHYFPGSHSPEKVFEFIRSVADDDQRQLFWLGNMDANGLQIEGVAIQGDGGEGPRRRLALLTPNEAGVWKIDFDALAETTTPGWSEWQKAGPLKGVMRVAFMPDLYYNGRYMDEREWACYSIFSVDAEASFFAYCKRASDQYRAMETILKRYHRSLPVTKNQIHAPRVVIAVSRSAESPPRQVEITGVLAEGLIPSSAPFDQTIKR